jgi:hypothetical protein
MRTIKVTYYGNTNNKKIANFQIKENDILELIDTVDYKSPYTSEKTYIEHNKNKVNISKKGFGEVVASFTKLFGFKTCAPCNKRRHYLNKITPLWISKIITKFYK